MGHPGRNTLKKSLILLVCLSVSGALHSRKPPKTGENKKEIAVFSTIVPGGKIPVLLLGQLENRLIATFSAPGSFSCQAISGYNLDSIHRRKLADSLLILSTNTNASLSPVRTDTGSIDLQMQKTLSRKYLLIFPELSGFSLKQEYRTETNRPPGSRTNVVKILTNRFIINTTITVRTLNPYDGRIRQFARISCRTNAGNRFSVFSAVVTRIGRRLAAVIENSSLFDLETEINHVRGNTIYFFHKHRYPLSPGQEFNIFEQKRYDDGFIDESRRGTIRIIEKNGALWSARIIQGSHGKIGYKIRPEPQAGITISPLFRFSLPGIRSDLFSSPASGVDFSFKSTEYLYGPALETGFQLGYNFQLYLGASWMFDTVSDIRQLSAGFGWDIYATRNLFFSVKISALFRWTKLDLGTINDASALDGSILTADTFTPGMQGALSLNLMLGRIFGGFLILRLEAGYNQFAEIHPRDWNYRVNGNRTTAYNPSYVRSWSPGGFFSTAGLNLRL